MKKKKKITKPKNLLKKRRFRLFLQRLILVTKLLLIATIFTIFISIYIYSDIIINKYYDFTNDIGFTVNKLTIEGRKHTNNKKISEALQIKYRDPIFSISLERAKTKLESIEWIKYAIVERNLPNNIHISIIEHTPIALGQKDHKLYIIDEEGNIIKENNLAEFSTLPIIIGEGAEIYANSLIKTLKENLSLYKRINSIIRISERRWNIRFDNDLEVKLPEDNYKLAWKKVIKMYNNKELFLPANSSIDLRVSNKIYVEKK